ncbi:hypothetical protein KR215_001359, partial [Drosophila sulfurigaster]
MTVKLAKLFGSSSSSNSNGGGSNNKSNNSNSAATNASGSVAATANGQQQPPPLPPPNANMKLIKYYDPHHHQHHNYHHHHHQPAAMTIYGHAYECNVDLEDDYDDNNMCMQRNHPYNNSQRPLLGERRPQLTLMTAVGKKKTAAAAAATPTTTTTVTTAPMAGIPLPAPPLPPQRQLSNNSACISPYVQQQKRDSVKGLHGFNDFDVLSQQYNQHLQSSPHIGYPYGSPPSPTVQSSDFCFDTDRQQREREREQSFKAISSSSSSSSNNSTATTKSNSTTTQQQQQQHCLLTQSSRFEDDFCTRRNVDFVASQAAAAATEGGPFIFGISHEQQQTDYGHRRCSISTQQLFHLFPSLLFFSLQQQSLSDTSADSGKGGKFLLRKRKSKKTAAAAAAIVANAEHKGKQGRQQQQQQQPSIKCVLVGDGAVGKTNLILSYLENRFNPEHVPTASDIYNVDVNVNESPVHLQLCDTAGQDTLDPLRELCYPDSDVFLLCFSVVKPETFGAIKSKWAPKFAKTKAALILVGTQSDLRSNLNVLNKLQTNGEKPISYADAWDLATTIGAKYIETSSATQVSKVQYIYNMTSADGL